MAKAVVITVSDSSSRGERADRSGPAVRELLESNGHEVIAAEIVPDDMDQIRAALLKHSGTAELVVTTGGTGISARDITPEATRTVCERLIEGVAERMRAEGMKKTPMAALSRGVCGTRGRAIILNLPGSPSAAVESLSAVIAVLPHALELLRGHTFHPEKSPSK
jgi:molybdopterin adenylyltransferase